jgi:hypothetical protein
MIERPYPTTNVIGLSKDRRDDRRFCSQGIDLTLGNGPSVSDLGKHPGERHRLDVSGYSDLLRSMFLLYFFWGGSEGNRRDSFDTYPVTIALWIENCRGWEYGEGEQDRILWREGDKSLLTSSNNR